ncbi:MAG: sigma-70 family RNA polymerase sigma factor [Acidimicrobiales bacterium]|jgi:RNA polymerase sigma-70 factor, ECF subfamily
MDQSDLYDRELVRRVASRDRDALTDLYQRHGRVLYGQILFVVSDRGITEEILQDTMVAVWRDAASFRGDSRVRSWMIAIARRKARDCMRRCRPAALDDNVLSEHPDAAPGPELLALDRVEMVEVAAALTTLRPRHREVLGLVFGAGLSLPEAADVLEIPVGTVKSRLNAARTALSEHLREKGYVR